MIKYIVKLEQEDRKELLNIINKGSHTSQIYRMAYILLNSDEGEFGNKIKGNEISRVLKVSTRMIDRVKQRFFEEGFDACLERKPMSRTKSKIVDGDTEAKLIAISCSKAPKGFSRWSLRLLAEKMVELKYAESISHETVRRVLKKTNLNLGK